MCHLAKLSTALLDTYRASSIRLLFFSTNVARPPRAVEAAMIGPVLVPVALKPIQAPVGDRA
jgi:hypothetical protein